MIRILIADDHAIVRSGLKQIIATTLDIEVVAEASSGDDVLNGLAGQPVDLLLLDMNMPGMSGLELIRCLVAQSPALPILVLSMHKEGQFVARALKAGARGYVTKDSEPEVLIAGIRAIAAGESFLDPVLGSVMLSQKGEVGHQPWLVLSERELQVLEGVAAGEPLGDIAKRLYLSPKTVSTHKMRLMDKLGIVNNADLMRYAIHHGLSGKR